jgi:hypothetical protein
VLLGACRPRPGARCGRAAASQAPGASDRRRQDEAGVRGRVAAAVGRGRVAVDGRRAADRELETESILDCGPGEGADADRESGVGCLCWAGRSKPLAQRLRPCACMTAGAAMLPLSALDFV